MLPLHHALLRRDFLRDSALAAAFILVCWGLFGVACMTRSLLSFGHTARQQCFAMIDQRAQLARWPRRNHACARVCKESKYHREHVQGGPEGACVIKNSRCGYRGRICNTWYGLAAGKEEIEAAVRGLRHGVTRTGAALARSRAAGGLTLRVLPLCVLPPELRRPRTRRTVDRNFTRGREGFARAAQVVQLPAQAAPGGTEGQISCASGFRSGKGC